MTAALKSLEGSKEVKLEDFEKGLFIITMDPKASIRPSTLEEKVKGYTLEKVEISISGTVVHETSGWKFTASESGLALELERPKEAGKEAWEQIQKATDEGKKQFRLFGEYQEVEVKDQKEKRLVLFVTQAKVEEKPEKPK